MSSRQCIAAVLLSSLAISRAAADAPEALYIFPAGGRRGTTVDVRIGGMHLFDECPLYFDATDVKAPPTIKRTTTTWFEGPVIPQPDSQRAENYPSDYAARLAIAADAKLGARWWRVSTSQGVTPSLKFVLGDLPEIVEQETDGEPVPVAVTLPVTINGRTFPREDVDEWSFRAVKGQTIRCEVEAERLGSPLDSQLEIYDAAGRRLAVNSDHYGSDSLIVFTAPADGEYRVRIFDAAYGGLQPYVYRLTLSDRPHVLSVYPLGGRRGTETTFEFTGINLSSALFGSPRPAQRGEGQGVRGSVAIPQDAPDDYRADFAGGVLLETGDVDELLETRRADASTLVIPCVANGRIDQPGDFDLWAFDGVKGQTIEFDLHAATLGSPLDSVLTIVTADGKELMANDDRGASDSDSRLTFTPPTDGRYAVRVSERSPNRGGPTFAYRLHVQEPKGPWLALTLPTDAITVDRGGTANKFKLQIERGPGLDGELKILIDGLPPGVTFSGDKVARGRNDANLNFTCAADVPVKLHECRVRVVTQPSAAEVKDKKKGEQPKEVEVNIVEAVGRVKTARGEPPRETLHLSTAMPTPFEVVGEFEIPYAQRGTAYVRHYRLERNGYEGPLTVRLAEKQMRHLQGVQGGEITVPAGVDEFDYAVNLPPRLELARTSRTVVTAIGEVQDEQGRKHEVCFTSVKPSEQISLIIGPGPLAVDLEPKQVVPATERPAEVIVQIDRGPRMTGPVRIELVVPPHVRGISAEPIVVAPGEDRGTLSIRFAGDAGPVNMPLTVRAAHGEGRERVVDETPLEVVE